MNQQYIGQRSFRLQVVSYKHTSSYSGPIVLRGLVGKGQIPPYAIGFESGSKLVADLQRAEIRPDI